MTGSRRPSTMIARALQRSVPGHEPPWRRETQCWLCPGKTRRGRRPSWNTPGFLNRPPVQKAAAGRAAHGQIPNVLAPCSPPDVVRVCTAAAGPGTKVSSASPMRAPAVRSATSSGDAVGSHPPPPRPSSFAAPRPPAAVSQTAQRRPRPAPSAAAKECGRVVTQTLRTREGILPVRICQVRECSTARAPERTGVRPVGASRA